ncbi:unnamed protein product [Ambrosiozyma monospora]|uniref:ATP synthase F(0) complex subunit e, mitochondrial n=1 Tax=Ambrosiozyma monospora TaxID=43982 RepID=A0A9W7DKH6_AMBMO|nr:unnamed protein product [Ambrosiozyma monospora]
MLLFQVPLVNAHELEVEIKSKFSVLRYTSLFAGLGYGLYHTQTLKCVGAKKQEQADYLKRVKLIEEAKAEFKKLNPPKGAESTQAVNLDDPKFDFGEFIVGAVEKLGA